MSDRDSGLYHPGSVEMKNVKGLKVGNKVRINENCCEPYIGHTGVILDIDEEPTHDNFIFHIRFDQPITGINEFDGTPLVPLDNEYFAPGEVDLLEGE